MIFLSLSCSDQNPGRRDSDSVEASHDEAVRCRADGSQPYAGGWQNRSSSDDGFTLAELLMTIAILGVLAAIAVPMYVDHKEKIRRSQAMTDIGYIQTVIDLYATDNRYQYPDSLADVKMDGMLDPWKGPYRYTRLDNAKGKGSARKDKNLVPINTDYDLWSNGPDGKSVAPLTAKASRDDIVRANNGRYVGLAADY